MDGWRDLLAGGIALAILAILVGAAWATVGAFRDLVRAYIGPAHDPDDTGTRRFGSKGW